MKLLQMDPANTLVFRMEDVGAGQESRQKTWLTLTNKTDGPVAFKVKTTAPKSYLVRPSSATLKPHEAVGIEIIVSPSGAGPAEKPSNHRFLVQAIQVDSTAAFSRERWSQCPKDSVEEQRLNVEHVEPEGVRPESNFEAQRAYSGDSSNQRHDLERRYESLVQEVVALEKNQKYLKHKLNQQAPDDVLQSKGSQSSGYSLMHVILVAVVCFLLSYAGKFLS
eukprot:TRINITY_DN98128_c0_g1_i1.p1 TRINITY_DN98128_c0_g1~~TRINITY_DN98128_c0_g1_i1.p1  ORF type:complete len:222 (+),score=18.65 TRINITY_DN98128_c0_g1_i1:117-782(+)